MSPRQRLLALAATLLLTACSRGPAEDDIADAVRQQFKGLPAGGDAIKEVKKIGCEKAGEAWLCDVSITLKMLGMETTNVQRLRLLRTDKGWVVSR